MPRAPTGLLVEVQGEVAVPGWHIVRPPTLSAAVEAAGGDVSSVPETPLIEGDLVLVSPDGVRVAPSGDPLLVSLPVDPNLHGVDALVAIPGVSRSLAEAIVASRRDDGPFMSLDDLVRVGGVGPSTLETMRPFLVVDEQESRRTDVNMASAQQLERLPGIGPALAERIVVDRDQLGRFRRLQDLTRVRGVGPSTVQRLSGHATVGEAR
jgi:competence protein ComEA